VNRGAIVRSHIHAGVERPLTLNGSRRSPKLSVMCPMTGQIDGVYEESAKLIGESKWSPLLEMAITAALRFKKVYCSTERSECILSINRVVALIESRRMIAEHPVGHGHFSRQGLQRIKPLVGVGDGTLELLILLLRVSLIVGAERCSCRLSNSIRE